MTIRTITVSHTISMGHRLPSYDGICSSLHGHNVRVEVLIDVGLSFIDFKKASDALKEVLEPMDHAMVLDENDPMAEVLRRGVRDGLISQMRLFYTGEEPTTEHLAEVIFNNYVAKTGYKVIHVKVHETEKYSAGFSRRD